VAAGRIRRLGCLFDSSIGDSTMRFYARRVFALAAKRARRCGRKGYNCKFSKPRIRIRKNFLQASAMIDTPLVLYSYFRSATRRTRV
jgi:hypothetical protein